MFDSPFVRRVAVTMKLLGLPFEHANWSVGRDFERIREFNPLGRVPTLVLDNGERLFESAAILDHLDEIVGPGRALLPTAGPERRLALNLIAMATGAADKGVLQLYERVFRPESRWHQPWLDRLRLQMTASLGALDRHISEQGESQWLVGKRLSQADVTAVCAFTFLNDSLGVASDAAMFRSLAMLAARCEAMPEFSETRQPFSAPGS